MSTETDAWAELQALKLKRDSRRRKLEERKKERNEILASSSSGLTTISPGSSKVDTSLAAVQVQGDTLDLEDQNSVNNDNHSEVQIQEAIIETAVLGCLCDVALNLPVDSRQLQLNVKKKLGYDRAIINNDQINNLLQKFAIQQIIKIQEKPIENGISYEIVSAEQSKLLTMMSTGAYSRKRKATEDPTIDSIDQEAPDEKKSEPDDVQSLLSMASSRERENKRMGDEILELLSRPTAKEKTLAEKFRSQGGTSVREFCPHGTKSDCHKVISKNQPCEKLHFRKIIQGHTDETLGDCSFLNTCFHMESCKYVHYEVDTEKGKVLGSTSNITMTSAEVKPVTVLLHPPQWIFCDLRFFDMTVLGKFSVIMADPPWDIHMELPYGTLSDDEMRHLNIPALQDEGLIFLWVTGRAMELGRECLQLWGYERVDELIWVKTNQLQRIIRTGRTGHWLNHGKEHCLVGMKGNPDINRGLDADVIVAEVRATSHKPDEVYGIIERLSPGTRKIELFGRPHNIQPNWVTLGNQLGGTHLVDDELIKRFYTRYPDGNCLSKSA